MKNIIHKLFLTALTLGMSLSVSFAQPTNAQIVVDFSTPVAMGGGVYQFNIRAGGGIGYVQNACVSGCNKNGSAQTIDIRIVPPVLLNANDYTVAAAPGYTASPPATITAGGCYLLEPAVGFLVERLGGTPDLPLAPNGVIIATVTVNSASAGTFRPTTSNTCASRESFWSNSHPDNTGARLGASASPTPLGVDLLTFSASATSERTAKLEWQTATEKNSSHFIVERSADGSRFTDQVCRMDAAGASNALITYHNFDYKPLNGNNYYRLKMVDKDGSFKYSETRRVAFEAPVADVVALPNPFQNTTAIRVSVDQDQVANYHVMDLAGRIIRSGVWEVKTGVQDFQLPLQDAAAGNYILTVQGSTILAEVRLTKSN